MTVPPRREIFANPFLVILLGTSLLFILTVLGYWVSASVLVWNPGQPRPSARSLALAVWLDRNGPQALFLEFAVMLLAGVLAMVTDPWFSPRSRSKNRTGRT
jgi:hypothetical protein